MNTRTSHVLLVLSAFCAGLLESAMNEEVNIVNAEVLLREHGIQLTEEKRSKAGVFSSAITATPVRRDSSHTSLKLCRSTKPIIL